MTDIQNPALTAHRLTEIEKHQEKIDEEIEALKDERNKALKWGIMTLGTCCIALAGWLFQFLAGHPK
jgi:hypothetical protein